MVGSGRPPPPERLSSKFSSGSCHVAEILTWQGGPPGLLRDQGLGAALRPGARVSFPPVLGLANSPPQ